MPSTRLLTATALALVFTSSSWASPAPAPTAAPTLAIASPLIPAPTAVITPSPSLPPTRTYLQHGLRNRGILSDIESAVEGDIDSILSAIGTDLPSWFASGIPEWFESLPTGSAVLSSANVSSTDLDAKPTQVLNLPSYANWTEDGWNMRFHGNVYKIPDISNDTIDNLANLYLIGTSVEQLPASESAQAVNLTREIYVVQQSGQNVSFLLEPASSAGGDGESGGSNAVTPSNSTQNVTLPYLTTAEGDYDTFVHIANTSGTLLAGNETSSNQRLNVYAHGTLTGNATSYLVPTNGLTFISDIDDILRVTKIWDPKEGLLNSFARPFTAWDNMPSIYANWSESLPNAHFHYLTTTPEQVTRNYMDFILKTYPGGSFDTRPLNFSDVSATLSIRKYLLIKIFETFPDRKFVLVADTSNSDVMRDYPLMATDFPDQVQCIFLRNTSATDSSDYFPYDTSGFEGLKQDQFMFFRTPEDLIGVDVEGGKCWNQSVVQNVTFGWQGLDAWEEAVKDSGVAGRSFGFGLIVSLVVMAVMGLTV